MSSAEALVASSVESLRDELERILGTGNVELAFELFLLHDDPSDKELLVGETIDLRDDDMIDLAYEESVQSSSFRLNQQLAQLHDARRHAIKPRAPPASAEPTQIQVSTEVLLASEVQQAATDTRHRHRSLSRPRTSSGLRWRQSREATRTQLTHQSVACVLASALSVAQRANVALAEGRRERSLNARKQTPSCSCSGQSHTLASRSDHHTRDNRARAYTRASTTSSVLPPLRRQLEN